jgi:hypothetical protein
VCDRERERGGRGFAKLNDDLKTRREDEGEDQLT